MTNLKIQKDNGEIEQFNKEGESTCRQKIKDVERRMKENA